MRYLADVSNNKFVILGNGLDLYCMCIKCENIFSESGTYFALRKIDKTEIGVLKILQKDTSQMKLI